MPLFSIHSVVPTRHDHDRYWTWRDMLDQLGYYRLHGESSMDGLGLLEDFRAAEDKYPGDLRIRDTRMDLELELESRGVRREATQGVGI